MERTLKIAICDDEQTYLDILEDECLRFLEGRNQKAQIFCFQRGEDLLSSEDEFDIILLDVELQHMDFLLRKSGRTGRGPEKSFLLRAMMNGSRELLRFRHSGICIKVEADRIFWRRWKTRSKI